MALDTTSAAAAWHPLLTIADVIVDGTPAQTLRWSDVDMAMSDGSFYEGRISSMGSLRKDLGRLLETQFIFPELIVELYNGDDAMRVDLDANANYAGKACVLLMGQGTTVADYVTKFTGEVRQPDGARWNDETVFLVLSDSMESDNAILPANKIDPATYANAESKSRYMAIPEVLGDFRSTAGGGETIPGFCVDTTVPTGGQFTFGQHLESIEDVYLNGVSASYTVNQLTGPSLVTLDEAYDSETDAISANVRGRITATTKLYPAAEDTPMAWAFDVITAA
jgi:hypothetical protein